MDYLELYKKGIRCFDQDVTDIIDSLKSGISVCLSSAPNMGDTRLMDYLVYCIRNNSRLNVVYDSDAMLDIDFVYSKIRNSKSKTTLLVIPDLLSKSRDFKNFFKKISSCKAPSVLSVIKIDYLHLSKLLDLFRGCKPIGYIKIRKPLSFESIQSAIQSRRLLYGWKIPKKFEKRIHILSGGIIGLIKHICAFVNQYGTLDLDEILIYPPIVKILTELKITFDDLESKDLKKLGLVNSNGAIRGELLKRFLFPKKELHIQKNGSILRDVLDLFINKKGDVVTLDDINQHINPNGDFSLWRMYKLVSRLRGAIKDRYKLKNIKNVGYILQDC